MQAVILVGGEGTRLRPLTYDLPKPMAPILGKPYLEHLIDLLKKSGVKEIIFATCFKYDIIQDYFKDGADFGVKLFYEIENEPLGTAGAVKNVEKHITGAFLVFNGDVMIDIDIRKLIEFHQKQKGVGCLTLTKVEDPTRYGIIEVNENKSIKRFIEKPSKDEVTTNYINAGLYILEKKALDLMKPGINYSFEKQIFPQILGSPEKLYAFRNDGYWIDIGKPESYKKVQFDILTGKLDVDMAGYKEMKENIWIGKNVEIAESAALNQYTFIDSGAKIKENCFIGPCAVIGRNCLINEGCEVAESVIWPGAVLGKNVNIKDCIIGRFATIEDNAEVLQGNIIGSREVVRK